MKKISVSLLAIALCGTTLHATSPAPIDALKPMAFLADSCWKGTFPDGKKTDEHCFAWVYGGKYIRDNHTVRAEGKPDYLGESIYYFDAATRKVSYLYFENSGGYMQGSAELEPDKFVFPETQYVSAAFTMRIRAKWTRIDANTYEVDNETPDKTGKWVSYSKMKFVKQTKP
jgi:hypothetical protein